MRFPIALPIYQLFIVKIDRKIIFFYDWFAKSDRISLNIKQCQKLIYLVKYPVLRRIFDTINPLEFDPIRMGLDPGSYNSIVHLKYNFVRLSMCFIINKMSC